MSYPPKGPQPHSIEGRHFDLDVMRLKRVTTDPEPYELIIVRAGKSRPEMAGYGEHRRQIHRRPHEIQISVSPRGYNVQVFVDGVKFVRQDELAEQGLIG